MATDKEIAQQVHDLQTRGRDVPLVELPAYRAWSEQKLAEGVSEALIANLDARSIFLLPGEEGSVDTEVYEELLEDLEGELDE